MKYINIRIAIDLHWKVYVSSAEDIVFRVIIVKQNTVNRDLQEAIWTLKGICSVPSTSLQ